MTDEYGYTPFLSLSSYRQDAKLFPAAPSFRRISGLLTSAETLILLWARLLSSTTGASQVVFRLDGDPILVNVQESKWRKVTIHVTQEEYHKATALSIGRHVEMKDWALLLRYDEGMGDAILSSAYSVSDHVLEGLEKRLKSILWELGEPASKLRPDNRFPEKPSLSIVNPNPKILEGPSFLHQLIDFQSHARKIAIDYLGAQGAKRQMSYQELQDSSSALSMGILEMLRGAESDGGCEAIPLMIPQCPELYLSCLAILKAGFAFCPLNLDAPLERVKLITQDLRAKILLTMRNSEEQLKPISDDVKIVIIDELLDSSKGIEYGLPLLDNPEKLAYVMYTSGSTGTPKGVGISHRAASQALLAHEEHVPRFKRFLQFAAPTFDVSVFESFFPLVRGSTLVSCAREEMLGDLSAVMKRARVDASELTPTVAGTLLKNRDAVPSLRTLLTIGEMLTRSVVDEFGYSEADNGVLHGMYGPTEATIHCTVVPKFDRKLRVGVIGVPFPTVSAFILSVPHETSPASSTEILPQGAVGELALGGHQLAREYINRPEQTKAAFITLEGFGRVYRTGDKARLNADGLLECLGRISDGQVKLRGQRVELGEIENVVYKMQGVSHAMASVLNGLLIVFCLVESRNVSVNEIKDLYKQWLPGFMRPNETVLLRDAPRLPSGKLDRKAIEKNYFATNSTSKDERDDFANDLESKIAKVIMEELGVHLSRQDSLAARGLDSLRAIKIASRLRSCNILISVADLLSADTVALIAENGKATAQAPLETEKSSLIKTFEKLLRQTSHKLLTDPTIDKVLPCSPLQLAMLSETARSTSTNVNRIEVKFSHQIAFIDVKAAFQKVAAMNNILRSGFEPASIPNHPFVRVVWQNLQDSQFHSHIPDETRLHEVRASVSLSHPFEAFLDEAHLRGVFLIHHALYDQWSWDIMMTDLKECLSGRSLVDRPQFDSVAKFSMTYPQDPEYGLAEDYWREQLHEAPSHAFPSLHYLKADDQGATSVCRKLTLLAGGLDKLTQELRVSRPALISAAYGLLLSAYVGSNDVIFGTVSSGRSLPVDDIDQIIGPCISTLPLRVDVSTVRTARDLVTLVHQTSRDLLRHGALPLQNIQRLSKIPKTQRLFDTLFVWQESLLTNTKEEPICRIVDNTDFLDFALLLEIEPSNNTLVAKASFLQNILPKEQAELFLEQLDQIITMFSNSVDISLDQWCKELLEKQLSIEEQRAPRSKQTPLGNGNLNGAQAHPNDSIEKAHNEKRSAGAWQVYMEHPRRTAVTFVSDFNTTSRHIRFVTLSFQQLESNATHLACLLVERGIEQGDLVGILMEKSAELYVSILAVLKSGAGYFPIDPKSPPERICNVLDEAEVRCVIATPSLQAKLKPSSKQYSIINPVVDSASTTTVAHSLSSRLPSYVDHECPAYAISTSGTTGTPKTVVVSRRSILTNLSVLSSIYPFTSQSRYLQSCSQTFDVSAFDVLFAFRNGLGLCSTTNDVLFRDLEGIIQSLGITHLSMTSSVAAMIDPVNVPTVSCLISAGEVLSSRVLDAWAGRGLFQGYGPSEATNICTLRQNIGAYDFTNNIGHPLPTASLFVSSPKSFSPVPRGAVGELCIGGEQIFNGYIKRPDLMSQKVVEHPRWGRIYRTGDMARVLTDGSFCFLGRQDDQLKLRGQRIELGEIDNTLLHNPMVEKCATLVLNNESNGSPVLVSFCVLDQNNIEHNIELGLLEALSEKLPPHMIPNDVIILNTMPVTETGKIDRKALKERFEAEGSNQQLKSAKSSAGSDDEVSFSETEESLRDLFSQVTGASLSSVRRDNSLFKIGLDSINSVLLSTKIRECLSVQVDVSVILTNASIGRLAKFVESKSDADHDNGSSHPIISDIQTASDQLIGRTNIWDADFPNSVYQNIALLGLEAIDMMPCTPLQEAMLSNEAHSSGTWYQNVTIFDVFVEEDCLRMAWTKAVERHQILRTGFMTTNSARFAFAQVVLKEFELPWQKRPRSADMTNASAVKDADNASPTDFVKPPYNLQFSDAESEGQSPQLTLTMHHALYDAEAMSIILNDIQSLATNKPLVPSSPFKPYIQYMTDLDVSKVDLFWRRHLQDFEPCRAFDNERIKEPRSQNSRSHQSRIPLSDVEGATRRLGVTALCVYQAAWARFLSTVIERSDVCFGNVYSGRNLPIDGAPFITGPCFNTLPLRAILKADMTNGKLVQKFHSSNLQILPFQPSSLRRIQSAQLGHEALFDTLLLVQNDELTLDARVWRIRTETGDMDFPLIWEVMPSHAHNSLTMTVHWYDGLLSDSDVVLLFDCFDALLEDVQRYPSSLTRTPLLSSEGIPQSLRRHRRNRQKLLREECGLNTREKGSVDQSYWSEEDTVAREIVSKLAGVRPSAIALSTTVFELGLDSINAFQIVVSLRKAGYDLTAADVLEAASIAGIGEVMRQSHREPVEVPHFDFEGFEDRHLFQAVSDSGIEEDQIETLRPCTPMQCGILSQFIQSQGRLYYNELSWSLQGKTDASRLRWAWKEVMNRHEMLRTGFVQLDDQNYPFAMLTYVAGSKQLPWNVSESNGPTYTRLHIPPWRLDLHQQDGDAILQLTMLHALYDATALDRIIADIAALYCGQQALPIRSIAPAVANFLDQGNPKRQDVQPFWGDYSKTLQATKFPNLRPDNMGETHFVSVSKICSLSLSRLLKGCQDLGVSLQVAGQCAWARLLSAVVGEPRVTFGLVLSGRSVNEIEEGPVVFPCINTLPLGVHVAGKTRNMLRSLSDRTIFLMKWQNTPFPKVKKLAGLEGELFDSIFVYQRTLTETSQKPLPWKLIGDKATAEYPVSIELVPQENDALRLQGTFRSDLVPHEQGRILLGQLEDTLINTIFEPDQSSFNFEFLDTSYLSHVPAKETRIASPVRLLHEFVEQSANNFPGRIAFEFANHINCNRIEKVTWTYKDLDGEGNKIANLLLKHNISQGSLVAICFDKCPEASFSILGILKAGCAYVPLDPASPLARKKFILEDAGCKIVLTTQDKVDELESLSHCGIIAVDHAFGLGTLSSHTPTLERPITPDDVCYCLFTSGSTGTPKGCEITHDNVVQALMAFQRLFKGHWSPQSRWLQFASFHFDVSVLEQYWSWSVGICVTSAPRDVLLEDLPGAIRKLRITHIDLTPSLARLISPDDVPTLCEGVFITGGEQLRQEILDEWGDRGVIYNGYGPTEATIGCTMLTRVPKPAKTSNIGPQFDNVETYVLDPKTGEVVPRGAVGELCVSGPLVGRGYRNRKELTADKFQYLKKSNQRIYHTGDLVRLLHNGNFDFLTRVDDQVKLRGQRLEIGEINHVIQQSSKNIKELATLVLKHPQQPKEQIVSFIAVSRSVERRQEPSLLASDVHKDLRLRIRRSAFERLPSYMIPTNILILDFIPLSANNKVDVNALKEFYNKLSVESLQNAAQTNVNQEAIDLSVLETLLRVFKRYTGVKEVTHQSSLFEFGLDSISAISFVRALRSEGLETDPAMIMKYSTIESLAATLSSTRSHDALQSAQHLARQRIIAFGHSHLPSVLQTLQVRPENVERVSPCTALQEGIIFKSLESSDPLYFSLFSFSLQQSIDIEQLGKAWRIVTQDNEILRTRFVLTDDGYAQVALRTSGETEGLQSIEMVATNGENLDAVLKNRHDKWIQRHRGLEGDLWNVWIAKSGSAQVMCLQIFHALYDGISLSNILDEVGRSYLELSKKPDRPAYHEILPLGPLCKIEGAKKHWAGKLKQIRLLGLERPPFLDSLPITIVLRLAVANELQNLRTRLAVTEPAIFLACWLLALQRYFKHIPTIGLVFSGRALGVEGAEHVTGPMFNTIPAHIDPADGSSISEFITKCHSYNMASMQYQHTPLRDIIRWSSVKRNNIPFDSLFVFQKERAEENVSEKLWSLAHSESSTEYPLALEVQQEKSGNISMALIANAVGMSRGIVEKLASYIHDFFHQAVEGSDFRLSASITPPQSEALATSNSRIEPGTDENAGTFDWPDTALKMREEIALLAGLGPENIRLEDSIMELGLDSIDAIKLSARLRRVGISLSVSQIVQCRTIARMAGKASLSLTEEEEKRRTSTFHEDVSQVQSAIRNQGVETSAYEDILPTTSLQEGMIIRMLSSDFDVYYNHDVLELAPEMDLRVLCDAFNEVVSKDTILRTRFIEVEDTACPFSFAQAICPPSRLEWKPIQVSARADVDTVINQLKSDAKSAGLKASMFRLTPVVYGHKTIVIMTAAHAIFDGWSMALIHDDVARLCAGQQIEGQLPIRKALENIAASQAPSASYFWSSQLSGISSTIVGVGDLEKSTFAGEETKSEFQASQLLSFCRSQGVTPQTVGILCWLVTLAWYVKKLDVCFGLVLSGRDVEGSEDVVFPMMNTVPFRGILHGTLSDMLQYIQNLSARITEVQHYPLKKALQSDSRSSNDLFDTLFIYQKQPISSVKHPSPYKSVGGSSKTQFPVNIELEILNEDVIWRMAYKESVAGNALLQNVEKALKHIIDNTDEDVYQMSGHKISLCGLPPFEHRSLGIDMGQVTSQIRSKSVSDSESPWTEDERAVRSALSATAGIPENAIAKTSSLFHLGLDSISAIKVSSHLKRQSLKLSVSDMLKAATVQRMAEKVQAVSTGQHNRDEEPANGFLRQLEPDFMSQRAGVDLKDVETILPATAFQCYTLVIGQKSNGLLFDSTFFYELPQTFPSERLEVAWRSLVREFPILRTFFVSTGGFDLPYVQVVLRENNGQVVWIDGNEQSEQSQDGPNPPVKLYARFNATSLSLKLKIQHALYDAVSFSLIMSRFEELCNETDAPAHPRPTFGQYIREVSATASKKEQQNFWSSYLDRADNSTTQREVRYSSSTTRAEYFTPHLLDVSRIEGEARRQGLSIQTLFIASLASVIGGVALNTGSHGAKEFILGLYLANRSLDLEGLSHLVAPTVNIVPLKIKLSRNMDVQQVAHQIQSDLGEISRAEHCGVALHEIAQWTGVKIDCTLNFLKLPEVGISHPAQKGRVILSRLEDLRLDEWEVTGDRDRQRPSLSVPSLVADAYLVSVGCPSNHPGDETN